MFFRDYQITAKNNVLDSLSREQTTLLYSPTGSGKTVIAGSVFKEFGRKTLFLVNRQTLLGQAYREFTNLGISTAVIHNEIRYTIDGELMSQDTSAQVIVSLVGTVENASLDFSPELIGFDEAHKSTSETYQAIREKFPALNFGLTATPWRQNNKEGEHLSSWYNEKIETTHISSLINEGHLAKPLYYNMNSEDHVVSSWKNITGKDTNKRTIVFVSDTRHMLALAEAFSKEGISCEIITQGTELEDVRDLVTSQTPLQRNRILKSFRDGQVDVLISINALCEGFDEPLAKYCFICRNISSVALYHQMVGRVLRKHPDKSEGVIVDFCGNFDRFGPIEEWVWDIDDKGIVCAREGTSINFSEYREKKLFVCCKECSHVYDTSESLVCSHCHSYNAVNVKAKMSQIRDLLVGEMGEETLVRKLGGNYKAIFAIIENVNRKGDDLMRFKFNQMYFPLYDENGMLPKYNFIKQVLGRKNISLDDVIEFEVT